MRMIGDVMKKFALLVVSIAGSVAAITLISQSTAAAQARASEPKGEIVVGAALSLTGPITDANQSYSQGLDSYVRTVNEKGGINGYRIRLEIVDDGYQPQRALANVRQLVEGKGVDLLIGAVGTATTGAMLPYIAQQGIPYLFPYAGMSQVYTPAKPNVFTVLPDYATQMAIAVPAFVQTVKPKKLGIAWMQIEGFRDAVARITPILKAHNVELMATIPYQVGTITDFTPIIQQLKNTGADAVVFLSSVEDGSRFAQAKKRLGWSVPVAGPSTFSDASLVRLAGADAEGIYGVTAQALVSDKAIFGNVEAIVTKYYPQARISGFTMYGVGVGRLLQMVLTKAADPKKRADVIQAANSLRNVDIGIFPPITFADGQRLGVTSIGITQVKNGTIVRVSDWLSVPR